MLSSTCLSIHPFQSPFSKQTLLVNTFYFLLFHPIHFCQLFQGMSFSTHPLVNMSQIRPSTLVSIPISFDPFETQSFQLFPPAAIFDITRVVIWRITGTQRTS